MERDFLGLSGKEVKGEAGGGRQVSVSTLQWPFATQHFISHKAGQQKRPKNRDFDQYSGPRYRRPVLTMDSCEPKINTGESPQVQKTFISDKQGSHQVAMHPYHSPNSDSFGALKHKVNEIRAYQTHHHSIPVLEGSPFFPVHGARNGPDLTVRGIAALNSPAVGCAGGALAPRIMSKPSAMSAQLTMFYAGAVNVYNDIPPDKAQAIMSLASKVASDVVNSRSETPLLAPIEVMMVDGMSTDETQTQILNHKMPNCPMLPILKSVTSQTGPHSCSGSGIANDFPRSKATEIVVPLRQNEIPKIVTNSSVPNVTRPIVQRAVPQARNASLARFLEKRKERVSNASPYTCLTEGIPGLEENNSSRKTSLCDIASSSNLEHSSRLGSPNTKLEI